MQSDDERRAEERENDTKPRYAHVAQKLPEGGKVLVVSREFSHRNEDGKAVYTVRQAINPIRQNRKQLKAQGLSTKEIKKIEREARRIQRQQQAADARRAQDESAPDAA